MMKHILKILSVVVACVGFSVPASAAVVLFCNSGPGIDLVNDGCISGSSPHYPGGGDGVYSNSGGGDPLSAVQAAITAATGVAPVGLSLYGKSDVNPALFNLPGFGGQSGTWDVVDNNILIKYITVKAANSFALYELAGPGANVGTFSTAGILNNSGNQPNVSHMSFWQATPFQSPVPEPEIWFMMILGFGFVGGVIRHQKSDRRNALLASST